MEDVWNSFVDDGLYLTGPLAKAGSASCISLPCEWGLSKGDHLVIYGYKVDDHDKKFVISKPVYIRGKATASILVPGRYGLNPGDMITYKAFKVEMAPEGGIGDGNARR